MFTTYHRVKLGPDTGAWWHKYFLRDEPSLLEYITRVEIKGPNAYQTPEFNSPSLPQSADNDGEEGPSAIPSPSSVATARTGPPASFGTNDAVPPRQDPIMPLERRGEKEATYLTILAESIIPTFTFVIHPPLMRRRTISRAMVIGRSAFLGRPSLINTRVLMLLQQPRRQ